MSLIHICIGHQDTIHKQSWLVYDPEAVVEEEVTIVVQLNGKVKERMLVPANIEGDAMKELVLAQPKVQSMLAEKQVLKVIAVPGKLVNIVVK